MRQSHEGGDPDGTGALTEPCARPRGHAKEAATCGPDMAPVPSPHTSSRQIERNTQSRPEAGQTEGRGGPAASLRGCWASQGTGGPEGSTRDLRAPRVLPSPSSS